MLIETLEQLNDLINPMVANGDQCIISLEDNKSNIILQHVVVKHPLDFIRNLNDFSKNLRLPVSDLNILLIGFISSDFSLHKAVDINTISPYVYFKKPEETNIEVGSDASVPPTEA